MHYRRLGKSGLKVSELSLGAWITFGTQVDEARAAEIIKAAYDQGVNYFDNADVYAAGAAEIVMGKAIKDLPREALVISSKVFWPTMPGPNGRGLSRKHITESVHASLRRLQLDYLDLYFCHRFDVDTPVEEVVRTMDDLVHQGKILYWGTSEWTAPQIVQAVAVARQYGLVPPTMEQPQYNMFHRERLEEELLPLAQEFGIGFTTWSPLYYGLLSGKYNNGVPEGSRAAMTDMGRIRDSFTPEKIDMVRKLTALAEGMGFTTAQLALAWILHRKEVSSVITGATRVEQLDENLGAAEVVEKLTDDVLDAIEKILEVQPKEA
jgi:voltage-dependent potassium channel beta subunit